MRSRFNLGGAVVATGLLIGSFAGAFAGSGGAGADTLGGYLPLGLTTSTALTASAPTIHAGVESVTLTATVTEQLINGALITPSGSVQFSEVEYPIGGGENYYPVQNVALSTCLLGLPSLFGLWQNTCSASVTFALTYGTCGPTGITSVYDGTTDLLAEPSRSNDIYLPVAAATCTSSSLK